jgi:hypothetical protein
MTLVFLLECLPLLGGDRLSGRERNRGRPSDSESPSSNRARRSTSDHPIVPAVLDHLTIETRGSKHLSDDSLWQNLNPSVLIICCKAVTEMMAEAPGCKLAVCTETEVP